MRQMSDFFDTDKCKRFFGKKLLKKRIPITEWLPRYKLSAFFQDLLAGLTVSLTEVPQAIAFASVAGLSPEYGLYSCILGGIVYAIFGTSKDVNMGPTSIMSMMIQPVVANSGADGAVLMTFLCGVIAIALGVFNLGFVIEYFSYPVVAGFTCAASLEIASIQVNNFFGIKNKADSFIEAWDEFFNSTGEIQVWDSVLGLGSLIFLIVLREIKRFGSLRFRPEWSKSRNIVGITLFMLSLARNIIIILIGTALAYSLDKDAPFQLTGEVKGGFPPVEPPPFSTKINGTEYSFSEMISKIGISSVIFIPLIAILECVSTAKTFANGKSLDATQEILALGISNLLNSFINTMPITGSFSRTAINNASGVKTPLSGIFTSLIIIMAIAFLTPVLYYVPKATMAAVIICAMIYLFDYEAFVVIWKNKKPDLIPFLTTIVCGLTISLEYGILIGIIVNLLFVLYPSARPKITVDTHKIPNHHGDVIVFTPLDNLFFPAAENLRDKVLKLEGPDLSLVIDGKYIRNIDITVAKSVVVLAKEIAKRGNNRVIFWNFKGSVVDVCTGLDKDLKEWFRSGELEEVVQNSDFGIV